jgi:SulP family sulfate permease
VILSGVHDNVEKSLLKAGIVDMVGKENVCSDIHLALERAKEVASQLETK